MLAMSEINCIKTLRNEKGLSISKIAETMNVNWRTAKKYGDGDQLPQEKKHIKKDMPKIGQIVVTSKGKGKVIEQNVIEKKVVIALEDGRELKFSTDEIKGEKPKRKRRKKQVSKDHKKSQ